MPESFAHYVVDKAAFGVMAFCDEERGPYTVPLSLVRVGSTLYFHSAQSGRKVELARQTPLVSVTFVGDVQVPDVRKKEELDDMLADPSRHRNFGSRVFTTEFESVHITGRVFEVVDAKEKIMALRALCEKFTPEKMAYFDAAVHVSLSVTAVFKLEIEEMAAKRKRLDAHGNSMKDAAGWPEIYLDYRKE